MSNETKETIAIIEAEAEAKKVVEKVKIEHTKVRAIREERIIQKASILALVIGSSLVLLAMAIRSF